MGDEPRYTFEFTQDDIERLITALIITVEHHANDCTREKELIGEISKRYLLQKRGAEAKELRDG